MKLRSVKIENFKGIERLSFDLLNLEKKPRDLTCIVGDNGSGKTTVLQAIALPLSLATRRIRYANDFDWHGFLSERISSIGPTRIDLEIEFTSEEIRITQELFQKWYDSLSSDFRESKQITAPSDSKIVRLTYEQNKLSSEQGIPGVHQFLGRYYVKALAKSEPTLRDLYTQLGDIFWFDQHRNLGSVSARRFSDEYGGNENTESWLTGVENLREFLIGWWSYHTSQDKSYGKDYIPDLESGFQRIFPDRRFIGTAPKQSNSSKGMGDFYFLMQSGNNVYDLAEMSSGEQSIFPLLYEFVRLDISHSIVLIDELELHLHPPEQQRLLTSLSKIGPNCQFIVTTHSQYLTNAVPDEQEVHMEGGSEMRLSKLYVEGKLDSEVYTPVFSSSVTIEKGGGKTSIRPQARNDRGSGIQAGYLRDRDFDFDPPDDMNVPTVDSSDGDDPWGWRLNRHEIESYLLDPQIVEAKFGIEATVWQDRLCEAAKRIRWYQVARWTVGYARSKLPPHYKLQTKSEDVKEMRLPVELGEQASLEWCRRTIEEFHTRIDRCLCADAVNDQIESRKKRFPSELLDNHQRVLQWCSGKDLFAALNEANLQGTGAESPQVLCNILRDWVREHPDEFVGFFPEIAAIKQQMTGASPPEVTNESRQLRRIELE